MKPKEKKIEGRLLKKMETNYKIKKKIKALRVLYRFNEK
jgi:hypothetical protein